MRHLWFIPLVWALTGCGGSTNSGEKPASVTLPPPSPTLLPDRALSDREVEVFWGRDRAALRMCIGQLEVAALP